MAGDERPAPIGYATAGRQSPRTSALALVGLVSGISATPAFGVAKLILEKMPGRDAQGYFEWLAGSSMLLGVLGLICGALAYARRRGRTEAMALGAAATYWVAFVVARTLAPG
jgi:hypothetical protein